MLNKIFLLGRLTRDPELRRTQNGISVAAFTLAVDRDYKNQSGEKETDFIDCTAWHSTAEFAAKYLTKGRLIVVDGHLQIQDWTGKDGAKHRNANVHVDKLYFADSKNGGGQNPPTAENARQDGSVWQEVPGGEEDDLPFWR